MNRATAAQALAFDPASDALVAPADLAETLAKSHALPVVFTPEPDAGGQKQKAYRLELKATCDRIRNSSDNSRSKTFISVDGAVISNACLLSIPGAPVMPAVVISHRTWPSPTSSGQDEITQTVIAAADGRRAVVEQGRGGVIPPIPMPQI